MSYNNGLILSPVTNDRENGDIQQALGVTTTDVGELCTHANINRFSRYKPNSLEGYDQPSDALILNDRYALDAIATTIRSNLATMSLAWSYRGARAPYYRQHDFHRYYNGAIVPFMQANGQSLLVDLVSGNANPALFYLLMRSGALANKPFSSTSGIASSGTAVPSTRLDYCISAEDLGFSDGGSYHSILGAYLGLVIFQGTTYMGEIWSSRAVAQLSTRYNDMFIVPTDDLDLGIGTYIAVACAKKTEGSRVYYMPVYDDAPYPARFTLSVGGVDYYKQDRVGLATSANGSTTTMLRTTSSTVYVRMRIYNNTGHSVTLPVSGTKFMLSTQVQGTVVDQGGTHAIDRTQSSVSIQYPASDITIADGGYGDMVFRLDNIWSNDATTQPTMIESGSISIKPTLAFNRGGVQTSFPLYGFERVLSCVYGS